MDIEEAKAWLRGERSTANWRDGTDVEIADAHMTQQAYWIVKAHKDLDLGVRERPKCVVCGEEQTDLIFIVSGSGKIHVGFPVCDVHKLSDLKPDQYVMNNLIVEVH